MRNFAHLGSVLTLLLILFSSAAWSADATLNLKDADIRVLIDTVSEVTGKNFIIDPRVKARVTVVSSKSMPKEELYDLFLSVLQVHGFAAIPAGNSIKIVPDVSAKQGPVPNANASTPGRGDELVTRVVSITHVPAAQLVPILRPLIPQQGQLAAYQPSNSLVITDRAGNVNRLVKIIGRLDIPDQSDIEIYKLDHAYATDVARTLTTVLQKDAKGAALPGQAQISPDERTNSLLISGDKSSRLRMRAIIADLDTPLDAGGGTQIVFLKYAEAEELVQILNDVSQNSSVIAAATGQPGNGNPAGGATNANRTAGGSAGGISIQADPHNNAIIITGPPAAQQEIKRVISQLDIRRAQVMIEAIIAEVRLDLAKELGASFITAGARGDAEAPAAVTNLGGLTSTILGLQQVATGGALTPTSAPSIPSGLLIGGGDFSDNGDRWGLVVQALAGDTATNLLSTPTIVTMDNEESEFIVGQNVPFITGSFTPGNNAGNNPFQTIERQDIGLTLRVKPQINEGTGIKLEIEQETSSISTSAAATGAGAADIITNTRSLKNVVFAEDGQVIVLGGLIDDAFSDAQEKVPFFGDIPILGHLFKSTATSKTKTSLMVFIRPVILRDAATADAYTRQKYSALRNRQLEGKLDRRGLIRDSAGRLPELDDLITHIPGNDDDFITQY